MIPTDMRVLEEKIASIIKTMELQNKFINEKLDSITKNQDNLEKNVKELDDKIQVLVISDNGHYYRCPNTTEIKELRKTISDTKQDLLSVTEDSRFYSRNPNILIWTIGGAVALMFIGVISLWFTISQVKTDVETKLFYQRNPNEKLIYRGGESSSSTEDDTMKNKIDSPINKPEK